MASLSDHVRRDAEHAARSDIRVASMRYIRRMDELAKAQIKERIEAASQSGEAIDGLELGRAAAASALGAYLATGPTQRELGDGDAAEAEADSA